MTGRHGQIIDLCSGVFIADIISDVWAAHSVWLGTFED